MEGQLQRSIMAGGGRERKGMKMKKRCLRGALESSVAVQYGFRVVVVD